MYAAIRGLPHIQFDVMQVRAGEVVLSCCGFIYSKSVNMELGLFRRRDQALQRPRPHSLIGGNTESF